MGSCVVTHPPRRSAKILVIYEAMEADTINFMVMVKIMDFQGLSGDAEN